MLQWQRLRDRLQRRSVGLPRSLKRCSFLFTLRSGAALQSAVGFSPPTRERRETCGSGLKSADLPRCVHLVPRGPTGTCGSGSYRARISVRWNRYLQPEFRKTSNVYAETLTKGPRDFTRIPMPILLV